MESGYKKLFKTLPKLHAPKGLKTMILARIEQERMRQAKIRVGVLGTLSVGSFISTFVLIKTLWTELTQSGFTQYLSVIVSDSSVIRSYWKEVALSLTESVPYVSLTLVLLTIGIFVWSLANATRNARLAFIPA